jgi:hypothetical protein
VNQPNIRPQTRQEKAVLRAYLRRGAKDTGERVFEAVVLFSVMCVGLGFAIASIKHRFSFVAKYENAAVALVVLLAVVSAASIFLLSGKNKSPIGRLFEKDLKNKRALIETFTVREALEVRDAEDNGPSFYLDVGSGKVLFLMGQYLLPLVSEKKFPSRAFEVAYGPESRLVLDVIPKSGYLQPAATMPPFNELDFNTDRIPDDGAVLKVEFEQLKVRGHRALDDA